MNAAPWQHEAFLAKRDLYLAVIDGSLCKIGVSLEKRLGQLSISVFCAYKFSGASLD
jgi:hypothetical protein